MTSAAHDRRDHRPKPKSPSSLPPSVVVIGAPSSGAGKTTVACGLIAAFAARGLEVRCFKCGPDFLDGMQHAAALDAGRGMRMRRRGGRRDDEGDGAPGSRREASPPSMTTPRTANLDGWMQGGREAVRSTFRRHVGGGDPPDVCIVEGVMGLHDGRDGRTDDGSTAQVAKMLGAPVVLVVDASKCARSAAATALGHATFDPDVRLGGVVANMISGARDGAHATWIRDSVEALSPRVVAGGGAPMKFLGGLPRDAQCAIPERHLGLRRPSDEGEGSSSRRFERLATLMETNIDLDGILELGRGVEVASTTNPVPRPMPSAIESSEKFRCRIGIAEDAAFCFYYADNLHLLVEAGAELVPFSPISSRRLPPDIDGLYLGGGYPELHAGELEGNEELRRDVKSFCDSGAAVFAECGGLMYLADSVIVGRGGAEDDAVARRKMCGVFPDLVLRMTPHCIMYYATVEITKNNPIFSSSDDKRGGGGNRNGGPSHEEEGDVVTCRGQEFHYSEVFAEAEEEEPPSRHPPSPPIIVTPERPGAKAVPAGYARRNTFASYLHFYFASKSAARKDVRDDGVEVGGREGRGSLADDFVRSATRNSPRRTADAVSFASAATEMAFALGEGARLGAVTSACDYPTHARLSPRRVVCRSRIDAASMTSEEVSSAMEELKRQARERSALKNGDAGPPRHWIIDRKALEVLKPSVVFVQNTCATCDASSDDVLHALDEIGLDCNIVPVAPTSLEEMFQSIGSVGLALDARDKADVLLSRLRSRVESLEAKIKARAVDRRPTVLSLEGLAPLCIGGGWLPDIKNLAGCEDALGDVGGCPPRILKWREIQDADPDVLLISPCSASPARTMNELHLLASAPEFWTLRCVRQGDVYVLDHSMFSRPGPRLVEGSEMLAALLRGIEFDAHVTRRWEGLALKYERGAHGPNSPGKKNDEHVSHCTTELAQRFKPCFEGSKDDFTPSSGSLVKCQVTRCKIPGFALPKDRSAHTMMTIGAKATEAGGSLLLFGGEAADGSRLSDVWRLTPPSRGWAKALSNSKTNLTWEKIRCGKIHGENVPTPRSNHAAAICGDYMMVFGGWGTNNLNPLSHCELLHLETFCWTHCSTIGVGPPPRGNPTLVYFERAHSAVMFGGWNGELRLNDTWRLDMVEWKWEEVITDKRPPARSDHSAIYWEREGGKDTMIVFGGSVEGKPGSSSELWALQYESDKSWRWSKIDTLGPEPPARTSHAATVIGEGESAKMIVTGGTDARMGCGKSGIVSDAWVLLFGTGEKGFVGKWKRLDCDGYGLKRCRHSLAALGGSIITIWGGYDGDSTISDGATLILKNVGVSGEETDSSARKTANDGTAAKSIQERWDAEVPVTLEELPPEELDKAKRSKFPGALAKALHRFAVANGKDTYIDPSSGYSVFTQLYLKRRECCGNGCRHCPYGHMNVTKEIDNDAEEESQDSLEW